MKEEREGGRKEEKRMKEGRKEEGRRKEVNNLNLIHEQYLISSK